MGRILLDTTVLIDALRGMPVRARIRRLREAGDVPYICAINVEEVARGLDGSEPARRLLGPMRLAPLGVDEGIRAGTWRRDHAARGVVLSQAGCLIAAAAAGVGARLATGNPKDFPMSEIVVEHWPVGE